MLNACLCFATYGYDCPCHNTFYFSIFFRCSLKEFNANTNLKQSILKKSSKVCKHFFLTIQFSEAKFFYEKGRSVRPYGQLRSLIYTCQNCPIDFKLGIIDVFRNSKVQFSYSIIRSPDQKVGWYILNVFFLLIFCFFGGKYIFIAKLSCV